MFFHWPYHTIYCALLCHSFLAEQFGGQGFGPYWTLLHIHKWPEAFVSPPYLIYTTFVRNSQYIFTNIRIHSYRIYEHAIAWILAIFDLFAKVHFFEYSHWLRHAILSDLTFQCTIFDTSLGTELAKESFNDSPQTIAHLQIENEKQKQKLLSLQEELRKTKKLLQMSKQSYTELNREYKKLLGRYQTDVGKKIIHF